ncbi:hypothetical protein D7030_07715 [Flavobacteriaceae bacterium AU392]|nr:hypothetical protein D1817_00700 [Flavobacteriaceae bacterium]RKM85009.1 hypothetical protein D7030_07715 [Flavobacteriaceae bacterium AU392]
MKKLIAVFAFVIGFAFTTNAQEAKKISLEQTKGEFTQKSITVSEGTYVFEIANNSVGHNVGFVLVPEGKDASKPENHIKAAYVTKPVATDSKQTTNKVALKKGKYVYFCPLNPTPQYTLVVE